MTNNLKVKVRLLPTLELQRTLQELPKRLANSVVRQALNAGMKVIAAEARRLAPVGFTNQKNETKYETYPGALRDSVRHGTRILKGGTIVGYVRAGGKATGSRKADTFYAHMVEYGTKAHKVPAKGAKAMNLSAWYNGKHTGVSWVFGQFMHPGVTASPFMRPAFDRKKTEAMLTITAYIKNRLRSRDFNLRALSPDTEDYNEFVEGDTKHWEDLDRAIRIKRGKVRNATDAAARESAKNMLKFYQQSAELQLKQALMNMRLRRGYR